MVYKKFYTGVVIRVLAIVACATLIAVVGISAAYKHTIIVAALLIVGLTINLIWYVNKTNRLLSIFFAGLKESNDSFKIESFKNDHTYGPLLKSIQGTWDLLKDSRLEKEKDHLFLKYVIGNIGNGILAYTDKGDILLANPAAYSLFGYSELQNVSQLQDSNKHLFDLMMGEKALAKSYLRIVANGSILELVVYISHFKLRNRDVRLASFQNINEKLSQKEIDAWQGIIKVLSHEIMSSVSPITSLSDHLYSELEKGIGEEREMLKDSDFSRDLVSGLKIIAGRSQGIMDFVKKYRTLTTPIIPQFKECGLDSMIASTVTLACKEFENLKIKYSPGIKQTVFLDQGLIEQCMLNIIRNSWQSMSSNSIRNVGVTVIDRTSDLTISISDNGEGIDEGIMSNIFIPFFTSRKDGSGIGLSLSRQIMILHGGDIQVSSVPGKGTTVKLIFPRAALFH